jgi:DNA-binding GntR family transcriptional regulator
VTEIRWRSRIRLVDELVDVIRERIYEGGFPPGAPIRQERLAAELNVSRTPLREALRMLEREGLVEVAPGRGLRVVSPDVDALLAAYELREAIDGLAARLAATRRPPEGGFASALCDQAAALDPWDEAAYSAADVAFHQAVLAASRNEYVLAQLPIVAMTSQVFTPFGLVDRSRAADAVAEHEAVVAAIEAGDAQGAERLAKAHVRRTIESLAHGLPA